MFVRVASLVERMGRPNAANPLYNKRLRLQMTNHLVLITILCYAASLSGYVGFLATARRNLGRAATLLLAGGIVFHYLALLGRSRFAHTVPYDDLYGSLSLFGWLLAVTYLGLELFHRDRSVGAFVLPFVLVVFLLGQAAPVAGAAPPPARGPLLALHITLNILGYAAFALSFVLSLIYLLQNRLLRHRHLGNIVWRFPALETLERMSRSSVVIGLVSLTAGIALGLLWVNRIWGRYWNGDPKEIISLVILAVYAGYLWLGRTKAWRGARASALCVFNFIFVLFSYSIVNLYLSNFHRYF
jgi:ABC-type transport system involved in cytochrome c biogenesis permease subunit